MEDLKVLVREILEKGYLMSLGVVDENGVWVSDVTYVHDDDLNLYWISDPKVRHSQAIDKNNQVAATITVSNAGEQNLGIQVHGHVQKIEGEVFELAVKHALKRKKPVPTSEESVLKGRSWYKLKPVKIDLIYEPKFGFHKQHIEL